MKFMSGVPSLRKQMNHTPKLSRHGLCCLALHYLQIGQPSLPAETGKEAIFSWGSFLTLQSGGAINEKHQTKSYFPPRLY